MVRPGEEINPHASYLQKFKLSWFGESIGEKTAREALAVQYRKFLWKVVGAMTAMTEAHWSGTVTAAGGGINIATNIGIGATNISSLNPDNFNHWPRPAIAKLKSLKHSPTINPSGLPLSSGPLILPPYPLGQRIEGQMAMGRG